MVLLVELDNSKLVIDGPLVTVTVTVSEISRQVFVLYSLLKTLRNAEVVVNIPG